MADMSVLRNGEFSFVISSNELSRGLRPTARAVRNSGFLVECTGAIGQDGVLSSLDEVQRLGVTTTAIEQIYPFPQIFDFMNLTIVCDAQHIYEVVSNELVLKYTSTQLGGVWCAVDFYDYVYLSNGVEAVTRSASSKEYALSDTLPSAQTMCNYNSQVFIGAYDSSNLPLEFWKSDDVMTVTTAFVSPYLSYMLGYLITEDELYYITDESGQKLVVEKGVNCG